MVQRLHSSEDAVIVMSAVSEVGLVYRSMDEEFGLVCVEFGNIVA